MFIYIKGVSMFKKIAITLLVLTLIVVIGGTIAVKVYFTEEKIIAWVTPPIETALDREVNIGSAKAMVFPYLGVEISDFSIANTQREGFRNDDPFIALKKFEVKIDVKSLLAKAVVIDKIVLVEPDILVEVDREGSFNFDDLAVMPDPSDTTTPEIEEIAEIEEEDTTASEPLAIPVAINAIIIEDGRLRYFDAKGGHSLVLGKINDRTDFTLDGTMKQLSTTGELLVSEIAITTGAVPVPLTDFTVTFNHNIDADLDAETVTINDISASLQKIAITLTGDVSDINGDAKLNLELNSNKVYLQEIINEIPRSLSPEIAKITSEGFVQLRLGINGTASAPAINGAIKLDEGKLTYADFAQSINDIAASIQFTESSLDISQFGLKLGTNPVNLSLKVDDFADPTIDGAVDAKLKLDDLREMMALPDGFTVGGLIEAGITAQGKVDPENPAALDIQGSVAVTGLRAKTVDLTEPILVDGTVQFSPEEIKENVMIKIADSDIAINASLKNYLTMVLPERGGDRTSLYVDLRSTMLNTNKFLSTTTPAATATEGETTETAAAASKPVETVAKDPKPVLTQPLPDIDMNLSANIGTLIYDQIVLTNINGSLTLLNQIFAIAANANIFNGSTAFGLKMDANNLNDVKITVDADVDDVQVDRLISACNDQLKDNRQLFTQFKKLDGAVTGGITFNSDFATNGHTDEDMTKNLTGTIFAEIADGTIQGGTVTDAMSGVLTKFVEFDNIEFQTVTFDAHIADEKLFIDTLDMDSPRLGDWLAFGPIGFDASLDMTVETRLTKATSEPIVALQSRGKDALSSLASKYLGGTGLESTAQGLIDKNGVPVDADGRVTAIIGLGGTVMAPDPSFGGFKMFEGETDRNVEEENALRLQAEAARQALEAEAARRKAQAEAELARAQQRARNEAAAAEQRVRDEAAAVQAQADQARRDAEAQARREAEEAQRRVEEEAANAGNKARDAVKRFGF